MAWRLCDMACAVVELSDGKLKGTIGTNYKGEEIYAFLGIPYGKPPVGELRFQVGVLSLHEVYCNA